MTSAQLRRRRRPAFAMGCVAAGVAMMMIATAPAAASDSEATVRRFKPMTYNVYLGANLQPLFGVTDPDELMRRAAEVFAHVERVDFNVRAVALAREIIDADPDVVALQELSLWATAPVTNPGEITVRYDFLQILLNELARQGAGYRAAVVNPTFSGRLPISKTTLAMFTDRNAIIVRSDVSASELSTQNPAQGTFAAALPVRILNDVLYVRRGWASIDVHVRDRWYRVIDTHLEAFVPAIREAQVAELIGLVAAAEHPVVLAGDLNVYPEGYRVVDAEEWQMFRSVGMEDSWVEAGETLAFTAGQSDDLDNVPSSLDNTVDFVLHDSVGSVEAAEGSGHIAGEELEDRTDTVPPLWPSDHAGVVVTLGAAVA
jgi:endonuclease/exonuclease/phosphatase family metal-dependent hydrolase